MRTIGRLGAAVLLLGLAFLLIRAATFTAPSPTVDPPYPLELESDAVVERLAQAIRIPTVTRGEAPKLDPAAFDRLHAHLKAAFPLVHTRLSTETVDRHTLLFTWTGSEPERPAILLMAHQDVVPVDSKTDQAWTHPPFEGAVKDGFIWGRGTMDVKNAMLGILEAIEHLLKEGHQPKRTVYLSFGHDEEIGGHGARTVADLLKKRGVRLEWVLDEGGMILTGAVPSVTDPVAVVGVAEKGYASLGLTTEGTGGHSSMPPPQTAIGVLSEAIRRLEQAPFPARLETSRAFFREAGPKMTFGYKIVFANFDLFSPVITQILSQKPSTNATIRTTMAATVFHAGTKDNVLPARARAIVNFRILPGDTPESVQAYVKQVIDDPRVQVDLLDDAGINASAPSPISRTDRPGFEAIRRSLWQATQDPTISVAPFLFVGATDARHFRDVADDIYRFQPIRLENDDLDRIHGTDERLAVKSYLEAIRFYYTLVKNAT